VNKQIVSIPLYQTKNMAESKNTSLGSVLRQARDLKKLALRSVEEMTGISNAYLSQLENDKIKKPSADILHKLAIAYKIDFNYLLHIAGLVEKSTNENVSFGKFVFSKDNLTKEEEEELIHYLQFIRQRKKK
jgi:HTH-type transcriptional regulator, competence development regulator